MSGAKAILRYTAVSNEGEMLSEGGGGFIFSMSIVFRGGLHVFHCSFFLGGGGCFKASMSEGMDGIRRANGWVGRGGGNHCGGGGAFSSENV